MKKCILLVWVIFITCAIRGQGSTAKVDQTDWRETFEFLSPQPNSKYHNINTRIGFRTGNPLNIEGLIQNPEGLEIMGAESGLHEYGVLLTRDRLTVNVIPKTEFVPGESVTVNITSGISTVSGVEINYTWTFETSDKLPDQWTFQPPAPTEATGNREYTPPTQLTGPLSGVYEGNIFINTTSFESWLAVHDFEGNPTPLFSMESGLKGNDFKVNHNGLPSYFDRFDQSWRIMDTDGNEIDSIYMINGYLCDNHDFQILPDWQKFMFAYDDQVVDMSEYVSGGDPNAIVEGFVIQEHDAEGNLILQWRSWDYFELTDNDLFDLTASDLNLFHINSIEIDADHNIIFCCRHTNEITKIDRFTGEIIWRWGGSQNMFTTTSENAFFSYQHEPRRLENGNILVFDNANTTNQISRSIEYSMNEEEFTFEIEWQYVHPESLFGASMGGNQRLPNGNTFIYWGNVGLDNYGARVTEVTPDQEIVLEIGYPIGINSYRVPKHVFTFEQMEEGCGDPSATNYDPSAEAFNWQLCLFDQDGDGFAEDVDCNDDDDTIYPGADEILDDGIDQDCNGYDLSGNDADLDNDGVSQAEGDCNDDDETIYPGADEIPYDGIDQDCDGQDLTDVDNDGFTPEDGDCNDNDDSIYPGAEEIPYDGVDQDCDGQDLDDLDMDGFSLEDGDCNDDDENINPDAEEVPYDGIDQDCDGTDLDDLDEDGFSPEDGDCNDDDDSIYPGAEEIPNDGIDQDCDGDDLIVSVEELEQELFLVSSKVDHVQIIGLPGQEFNVFVHDLRGQLLTQTRAAGVIRIAIDLWASGIYTFTCTTDTDSKTYKLFIE